MSLENSFHSSALPEDLSLEEARKRFDAARSKVITLRPRERHGIGIQSEKTLHAVLKNYIDPDEDHQEIPIDRYIADIFVRDHIIEIQTANMNAMRAKLACFLPQYPVRVVYPIPAEKWIIWVDPETGEIKPPRKSPKKGHPFDALNELISIKKYLSDPKLHVIICILETEEYTILDGYGKDRKKHATRADKIPVNIIKEYAIDSPDDYINFLPDDIPDEFTTKDIAEAVHRPIYEAQALCNILSDLDLIEKIGNRNRYHLYTRKKEG